MQITNLAIKHRTGILVLTAIFVLGGLFSYVTIPKEAQPSIEIPNIVITTLYPGASPGDIESLITQPIERQVQSVNGIKMIRSISTEGVSTVIIEFDPSVSMDEAYQKTRDKVDLAKADLPSDVEEPMVNEIEMSQFPIMTINLAAGYSLARLKDVAEDLRDEIEKIPSILEVDLIGGLEQEVQVSVDLAALQGYNLSFDDLVKTIRQENANIPGGSVDVDRMNYLVRVSGQFKTASEIEALVVKAPGGEPIYVRDMAQVRFGFKDRASHSRLKVLHDEDDEGNLITVPESEREMLQVISLNVKKRSGDNIIETSAAVEKVLAEFPLPAGTRTVITGNMSEHVEALVKDLENNIISGLIFVVAVLLFFLGVRNAFLVGVAIPLSMFVSFILFDTMGYTLNFIILFSLIIALGMLVDNAIVIVENIFRYREEGHSRWDAARLGTAEVGGAVVASTATTVAAFAPMLFWPGIIGEFMSYLPLTLIITLTSSLFVAIIINPVVTGIFVQLEGEKRKPLSKPARRIAAGAILMIGGVLAFANWKSLVVLGLAIPLLYFIHTRFFKPVGDRFVQRGLPGLIARYRRFLGWMLERDYSGRRPFLRNTLALGSFTGGLLLLILGAIVSSGAGQAAGMVLTLPGGILLAVGIIGIIVHTLESLYLGGRKTVKAGIGFGVLMLSILGAMYLSPREVEFKTIVELMVMPAVVILAGVAGMIFNRKRRTHLLLTDNRARLLNGSLGALVGIIAMFVLAPTGVTFFPDTDPNQISVTIESPLGTNLETSNAAAMEAEARIEELLRTQPSSDRNLKNLLVNVGVGGDFFSGGGAARSEVSRFTLNLVDYEDRAEPSPVTLTRLREQIRGVPGTEISFGKDDMGPPTGAPVNIEISGKEFDEITRITRDVKQQLVEASETGRIPGLVDIADNLNSGRPELQIDIDRERAVQFGLNSSLIATTVRSAINGIEAGKYRTGEDEFDITVRLDLEDRQNLESIRNLTVLHEGRQIPLSAVADFSVGSGLGSITRLDLQRVATVTGEAAPGFNGTQVLGEVQQYLKEYEETLPAGYSMKYTGENEEQQESFGFLTTVLLVGVALIFLIMVAQFNTITAPFIIMVAVGFGLVGVLLGLILTRTPFGLFTFIGIISLAGIIVNNNIVLLDYMMQLRERGLSKTDAIIEAGATRLRPVMLTALTTILGLIPLTFGINIDFVGLITAFSPNFQFGSQNTQFWGPMGTAIISGLAFATFLTMVIVPVMYSAFDSISTHLGELFGRGDDAEPWEGDGVGVEREVLMEG